MMHATSESDVTSIGPSTASPRAYYVQSPSRDSQDEMDKCSSTNGPCPSPSDPRQSMSSSSTAFSRIFGNRRRWNKHYCNVVAEEGGGGGGGGCDDDDYYGDRGYPSQCNYLILVMAFGLLFAGISLVVWGAGRHYKAQVSIKRLRIQNVHIGQGSDRTGVPTKFITVNCSASLQIYNPATFFGIHVSSHSANLIYSQITVATGQLKKYYQPRKSRRIMWVRLVGKEVPLYGAATALAVSDESGGGDVPLKLEFEIESRGHLMGKLVTTKHTVQISCSLLINSKRTTQIIFEKNSCKYL